MVYPGAIEGRERTCDPTEERECAVRKRVAKGASIYEEERLDRSLQLFASDIDDREGGGDAIKSERASTTLCGRRKRNLPLNSTAPRKGWSSPANLVPNHRFSCPGISRSRFEARLCWRYWMLERNRISSANRILQDTAISRLNEALSDWFIHSIAQLPVPPSPFSSFRASLSFLPHPLPPFLPFSCTVFAFSYGAQGAARLREGFFFPAKSGSKENLSP